MQTIDIRNVPIKYLHNPAVPYRKEHVDNALSGVGLRGTCFEGVSGDKYRAGAKGFIALLEEELVKDDFRPFIMLEDDISATEWFKHEITFPADADAVYIGIAECGVTLYENNSKIELCYEYTDPPSDVARIYDMLSIHAVLVLSKRWALYVMRAMALTTYTGIIWDQIMARNMYRYNVYACIQPLFYQDPKVQGNVGTHVTIDQVPKIPFAMSHPDTTISCEPPVHLLKLNAPPPA